MEGAGAELRDCAKSGRQIDARQTLAEGATVETVEEAQAKIFVEITQDDPQVRSAYIDRFSAEAKEFSKVMATAMLMWLEMHGAAQGYERRTQVSALVYTATSLHIGSMKLFLSGNTVASGNLFRQVVETVALSLLCSGKDLDTLTRFAEDQYSTQDAVRDVLRNSDKLGLKKTALEVLRQAQGFYSKHSHPSKITIGVGESFAGEGIYIGASPFDKGKDEYYAKEIAGRLGLATAFPNFVEAVRANIAKW